MRKARARAKRLPWWLLWLPMTLACGAVPTGNDKVDDLANGLCAKHEVLCVGSSTKEALDLDGELLDGFWWGRSWNYGEIEIADQVVELGFICWDDKICADDLDLCAGVILHEIGHQKVGSDQSAADCWAIQHATPEQAQALADLVCTFRDPPRCDAARSCLQ